MKRLFRPIQNLNFLARVSVKSQIKKKTTFLAYRKKQITKKRTALLVPFGFLNSKVDLKPFHEIRILFQHPPDTH